MSCHRLSHRPRISTIALLALSALAVWLTLPGGAQAKTHAQTQAALHAKTRATTWRSAWRPGWLPGDPEGAADPNVPPPVWAPRAARAGRASGLFIALDPITHLPTMPSDAQKRAFAAQMEHDALLAPTAPFQIQRLPGGGEIIHLNGQFQVYSIARRDSRGRIVTDCAPDPAAARKLLTEPAPPSTTVREEK